MSRRLVGLAVVAGLGAVGLTAGYASAPGGGPPAGEPAVKGQLKALGDPMTADGQARRRAAGFGRQHTPSPLIIPEQTIPLRFSHRLHVGLRRCEGCHLDIRDSVRARDRNLPPEDTCLGCHDVLDGQAEAGGDPPSRCSTCHPGFEPEWLPGADRGDTSQVKVHPPRVVLPPPNLKFNHKLHLAKGVRCDACHGAVGEIDLATADNALPVMGACLGCHDGRRAPRGCATCHLSKPDGRVQTRLEGRRLEPAGWYRGDAHDDRWIEGHRAVAALDDAYCATCHTKDECMSCHNGVRKPLSVHPNNWILTHTTAARRDVPGCASCHRSQTFCVDCHQQTKVVTEAPNTIDEGLRFHPDGWVGAAGVGRPGGTRHSVEAKRNVRSCAACHTERSCTECHAASSGGPQVNPHPAGFVSSGACDRMRLRNDRVCAKCHRPGSRALRCQR